MRKIGGIFLKVVLPLLIGFFLVYLFFRSMPESELSYFFSILKRANYWWFALSLVLSYFGYVIRAYRWKYALEKMGHHIPFWNRFHATMIGYLVNLTIPRAGEASRALMLYRSNKVPFLQSFGSIIVERLIDFLMLILVSLFTFILSSGDFVKIYEKLKSAFPNNESFSIVKIVFYVILGTGVIFIALLYWKKAAVRLKIKSFFSNLWTGIKSTFQSGYFKQYLLWTLLMWFLYIFYFAIAFNSLPETSNLPLKAIFLAFIAGALGISFTNGGLGSFPLLVGLTVSFFLEDEHAQSIGNALGMLIWLSQTIFLIIFGLISLILLPKPFKKEDEPA